MEFTIIVLAILLAFVLICLIGLVFREKEPSIFNTYYGAPPGNEPVEQVQWEVTSNIPGGETLVQDAELVFDEVPVFLTTEVTSSHIGQAVVFKDGDTYNALVEIFEAHSVLFENLTASGLNGINIAALPTEAVAQEKEGSDING